METVAEDLCDFQLQLHTVGSTTVFGGVDAEDDGYRLAVDVTALIDRLIGEVTGALVLFEKCCQLIPCHLKLTTAEVRETAIAVRRQKQAGDGTDGLVDDMTSAPTLTEQVELLGTSARARLKGGAVEEEIALAHIK